MGYSPHWRARAQANLPISESVTCWIYTPGPAIYATSDEKESRRCEMETMLAVIVLTILRLGLPLSLLLLLGTLVERRHRVRT